MNIYLYKIIVKLGTIALLLLVSIPCFFIFLFVGFYSVATLGELFMKLGKVFGMPGDPLSKARKLDKPEPNRRTQTLKEVWQKWCDLPYGDFDKWLHEEMNL